MRLGHYKSGGLEVTMTPNELAILGTNPRLSATVNPTSDKDWIKIEVDPNGLYKLSAPRERSGARSFRFRPGGAGLELFGAETVVSWSSGKGVLFGHRPTMQIPMIVRSASVTQPRKVSEEKSFQVIHDAVNVINSFAAEHRDLELTVVDGKLVVRMYIEFGK